jgi:hypothetical protein
VRLDIQLYLPLTAPECVTGHLWVHVERNGLVTVGHEVTETATDAVLAAGSTPALTHEEAVAKSHDLLTQYLRVLPSVVDAPPFP